MPKRDSRSSLGWRVFAMLSGTALGQGAFFAVSLYYLATDPAFIGNIGTGYGLAMTMTMVVDWGGNVTQRQFAKADSALGLTRCFTVIRAPAGMAVIVAVLALGALQLPNQQISAFLYGAMPGVLLYGISLSGLLDVLDSRAQHAYFQGMPAVSLSAYLLASSGPDPTLCGAWFSAGSAVMHGHQIWRAYKAPKAPRPDGWRVSYRRVFIEGFYVLLFTLPGQLISRLAATGIAAAGLPSVAAIYNVLKQSQGLLNQAVTLLRRAEYGRAERTVFESAALGHSVKAQKVSLFLGATFGVCGNIFLLALSDKLSLPIKDLAISFSQCLFWLCTSSYFFVLQLKRFNNVQALYGVSCLLLFAALFYLLKPQQASTLIALELAASAVSFILALMARRYGLSR